MALIYSALTILFGAIPATYLCLLPIELIMLGAAAIGAGDLVGLFLILYAASAVFGTISLWMVAFFGPSRIIVVGLVVGTLVISPYTLAALTDPIWREPDWPFRISMVLPPIVAMCWIAAFARDRLPQG